MNISNFIARRYLFAKKSRNVINLISSYCRISPINATTVSGSIRTSDFRSIRASDFQSIPALDFQSVRASHLQPIVSPNAGAEVNPHNRFASVAGGQRFRAPDSLGWIFGLIRDRAAADVC